MIYDEFLLSLTGITYRPENGNPIRVNHLGKLGFSLTGMFFSTCILGVLLGSRTYVVFVLQWHPL